MSKRLILSSELAIMREAYDDSMVAQLHDTYVLNEEYGPPRRRGASPMFNTDFCLIFELSLPPSGKRIVTAVPVKPNTIGADCFVTKGIDGNPVMMEMIGGEAIPINSFSNVIERVDEVVVDVLKVSCRKAKFLRLFELTSGISFLVSKVSIEEVASIPANPVAVNNGVVFTRCLNGIPVMVDGVLDY
jgi:hypothetical protein